jgi:heat shock protein HslJ
MASLQTACADRTQSESDTVEQRGVENPEAAFRAQIGHTWELARLGPLEIAPPAEGTPRDTPGKDLVPGRRPTLRFSADPQGLGGRSFCNGYGSPYTVRGDSLLIPRIESTAVGCDGPDTVETRFFRGLRTTRRFVLSPDSLKLIAEDGSALVFVPASP